MADSISTSLDLRIVAGFADGDERTITLSDPKSTITAAQINALNASASSVLIGDKYGAPFLMMKDAEYVSKTVTKLDLS